MRRSKRRNAGQAPLAAVLLTVTTELLPEHPILLDEILNRAPLLACHQPGKGEKKKLKCLELMHDGRQDTRKRAGFVER